MFAANQLLTCLFLCWGFIASAQSLRPLLNKKAGAHAVVVGVSQYQDEGIRNLSFAHRDAEIFAEFLQSKAGGSLSNERIRLLTDQQATLAGIQAALQWLVAQTTAGERAIIYFSGHGDVETISERERGYLLAHDTPKNNYRLNALDLNYLHEDIIRELVLRGVRPIVIVDACHAGTLAGEGIGGKEATALELMTRYVGEVKIMSCQPYEESYESPRWGDGRGVFSYYLVDGLKGRADRDRDQSVDLYELEVFLLDRIREATDKKQHPVIFGGRKTEALFGLDEAMAEALKAVEREEIQRDFERNVLTKLGTDEAILNHERFDRALKSGRLLSPQKGSAAHYYEALQADVGFMPFLGLVAEPLTTALLDSAQQAINAYLNTDPLELAQRDRFDQRYTRFAQYLDKAAEILGPKDPRYRPTRAKQHYFKGLALRLTSEQLGGNDSLYHLALEQQRQALQLEDRAAYIHNEIGFLRLELGSRDSGMAHLQQAIEIAPTWAIPYNNIGIGHYEADSLELAKHYYRQAIRLKPDFASAYTHLGNVFSSQMEVDSTEMAYPSQIEVDSAEMAYQRAIELNPKDKYHFYNYGVMLSRVYGRRRDAESAYRQAIHLAPRYPEAWLALGSLYDELGQPDSAAIHYRQAIELNPHEGEAYLKLGNYYDRYGPKEAAEEMFLEAIRLIPEPFDIMAPLANLLIELDRWELVPALPLDTMYQLLVLYNISEVFFDAQNHDGALRAYRLAANVNPSDPGTDFLLCTFYAKMGREKEALAHLEKTLQKARKMGEDADYLELVASAEELDLLRRKNKYDKIISRFSWE